MLSNHFYKMATYWKSQPRKFCDFCKCWITDNKPSIDFHEKGKNHQANVKKRIDEVKKKGIENARKKEEMEDDMQKMERAALEAFKKDLAENPALAAKYGVKNRSEKEEEERKKTEAVRPDNDKEDEDSNKTGPPSPVILEEDDLEWFEAVAENGYHYFWNTKTGESIWEPPEKFVSLKEQEARKKTQKAEEKNDSECNWHEAVADNGHHYYWNKEDIDEIPEGPVFGPQPRQPRTTPYGSWVTIKEHSPEPELDLPPLPDSVESIPLPEPPKKEKEKFKEKCVTSLGTGQNVAFKKRKLGSGARNIRNRDDD
ncbi:hypothetical protein KUTeg_024403 [Tegillarca granosa]|uniref:WW domain-binding protein 4 n=1 Tax=Tegillarca granosa TaxID=220873 RepID=A0ABQ9E1V3_TEGGR|nr:hypothetical protein KUTeg_024403 [Tegillarca granosa]